MRRAMLLVLLIAAVLCPASGRTQTARSIAITIDDLPFQPPDDLGRMQRGTEKILAALRDHKVPAVGFVNENKVIFPGQIDARTALLDRWLGAGMELGNHNFSHLGLNDAPLAEVEDGVIKGEVVIRELLRRRGRKPRWYRHPYGQTGATNEEKSAFDKFLAQRGYYVAPFTIENSDWLFNAAYRKAIRDGNEPMQQSICQAYLDHHDAIVEWFEQLARSTFGHDIPHVLLIHANELNADVLPHLLRRLDARGYGYITLDQALQDSAYQARDGYVDRFGPSWLHRWRIGTGQADLLSQQPAPPSWVTTIYQVNEPGPVAR